MTQVYLTPWLLAMAGASWVADWLAGWPTDHAAYFLFLGAVFAIIDALRIARMWMKGVRIRGIQIKTYGNDDPDFDRRWDEAMSVLHVDDDDDNPNVKTLKVDITRNRT
jgi:hypothetical protein